MVSTLATDAPVYLRAKRSLLGDIGKCWKRGQRLPTVHALAKQYKVGHVSMHRAVRELGDEGYLIVRPRAGIRVADRTANITSVPSSKTAAINGKCIDVVTSDEPMLNGMHRLMLDGVLERLGAYDCNARHRPILKYAGFQSLEDLDADALVVVKPSRVNLVAADHHLLVNIDTGHIDQFSPDRTVDQVTVNQVQGATIAGHTMRTAGITSVCFLGAHGKRTLGDTPMQYDPVSTFRLKGFEAGWGEALPPTCQLMDGFYDECTGAALVDRFIALDPMPQAVFAATDDLAVGFIHGALAHGLKPGIDYGIIGFDSQPRVRAMRWGPLTSVEIPAREMGFKAVELLVERFERRDRPSQTVALGCSLFAGVTHQLEK